MTTAARRARGPAARAGAAGPRRARPPLRRTLPTPRTRCRRRSSPPRAPGPRDGQPDNPLGWLIRVASRRLANDYRSEDARRRREELAASWSMASPDPPPGRDDTLILMFMCCHPSLSPALAIPLTLRAVGGLTTREIAAAFLVPEATMAPADQPGQGQDQGVGRAVRAAAPDERPERFAQVLHVLYLLFNEGYTTSSGPDLARTDLSGEAIRLARAIHAAVPAGARGGRPARAHAAHRRPAPGPQRRRRRAGPARRAGPQPVGPAAHRRGARPDHRGAAPGAGRRVPDPGGDRGPARPGRPGTPAPTGRRS